MERFIPRERAIIGLDPALKTGWCKLLDREGDAAESGVWKLPRVGSHYRGQLWTKFTLELCKLLDSVLVDAVGYEHVPHHKGSEAASVYHGLVTVIQIECWRRRIDVIPVTIAASKIQATGYGHAGKSEIMAASRKRWPGFEPADDNEADARYIALWTLLNRPRSLT